MHSETNHINIATMKVLILVSIVASCLAVDNDDGQYRPDNSGQYVPSGDDGRYYPDNSGQYVPDESGRYIGDSQQRLGAFGGSGGAFSSGIVGAQTFQKPVVVASSSFQQQAAPAFRSGNYNNDGRWKIIRQSGDTDTDGYHWEYETENQITAEESGKVHNKGTDAEALRAKGFFQYTGPDNVVYSVAYTADENGFLPQATHLPTPPPIPAAIARSLEHLRATNQL